MRSLKSRGGITRGRGVKESVRTIWTNSMHQCASVHLAMSALTGQHHKTSEQHIELGKSRIKRDNEDLEKLFDWFDNHEPFDINEPALKSLTTGISVSVEDHINCDQAED